MLFGAEGSIFKPLKESVDGWWLMSTRRAVQTLRRVELLDERAVHGIIELLLDWQSNDRAQRLFDAHGSLHEEYVTTLGLLLRGQMQVLEIAIAGGPHHRSAKKPAPCASWLATHVTKALDVIFELGLRDTTPAPLTSACMVAVNAIYSGASPAGRDPRLARLRGRVGIGF